MVAAVVPLSVTFAPFTIASEALVRFSPFSWPAAVILSPLCAAGSAPAVPLVVSERGAIRLAAAADDTDKLEAADDDGDADDSDEAGEVELRFRAGLARDGDDTESTGEMVV